MRRLLVRLPNWLGDLMMARPAVRALAAADPGARLVAVAPPGVAVVTDWDGVFERVLAWPAAASERAALAAELKAWRPDAALVLPPSFSSAWFAFRTGARERVGFAGDARDLLLTAAVRREPRGTRHQSEEYLGLTGRLTGRLGGLAVRVDADNEVPARSDGPMPEPAVGHGSAEPPPLEAPTLLVPEAARARAATRLAQLGVTGPYAVLGPGAAYGPAKRWPADRFAAVGRGLIARGIAVLTCGAAAEREDCSRVAAAIGARAFSLAGETDLAEQAALCAAARVAVCNDSGLAHLSAATGAATLAIFGSTSSAWTAPRGPRVRVVQHEPVCAPCFQRTCGIGYRCLVAVQVAEVLEACAALAA